MPRPPERMVIEPAETTSNNAIEQMVLDEEDTHCLKVSDAGIPYEERFSIPAEEQNAGVL